jgi:hypothetical protein
MAASQMFGSYSHRVFPTRMSVVRASVVGATVLGSAALGLLTTEKANASPVQPGTSFVTATSNDPTTTMQTNNSVLPSAASVVSLPGASGSVTTVPTVSIQTAVSDPGVYDTVTNNYIGGQGVVADLTYYFTVTGGAPTDSILVDIATRLSTTTSVEPVPGSNAFYGFASIDVSTSPSAPVISKTVCSNAAECSSSAFDGIISLIVNPGSQTEVHFEVESIGDPFFAGNAAASADPYIFIAPSNADASAYNIVVSSNVGNAPLEATPIPAALPLFACGLGALSLLGRRKKRSVQTAAV